MICFNTIMVKVFFFLFFFFFLYVIEVKGRRENQIWYLKISKLALAFAIIRSKPPGKSCKEYTEHLAKLVSQQDFDWKSKVKTLEAEIFRLRQELLLNKICQRVCLENGKFLQLILTITMLQ